MSTGPPRQVKVSFYSTPTAYKLTVSRVCSKLNTRIFMYIVRMIWFCNYFPEILKPYVYRAIDITMIVQFDIAKDAWGSIGKWKRKFLLVTGKWSKTFDLWAATWQNQQNDCVPSEDSDQSGHPPSLIRVFAVRIKKPWALSYPLSACGSEDSDQTGRMPRLIWVFAGRTLILLVLSCRGSYVPVVSICKRLKWSKFKIVEDN